MILNLIREQRSPQATLGTLYMDGEKFCYTLEDVVRPAGEKVPGATAIPAGSYEVIVNWSNRFGKPMPLLLNVPNFAGVRIHSGNTPTDTEGCILVGEEKAGEARIAKSRLAYAKLFVYIQAACKQGKVLLTITEEFPA